VRQSRVNHRNTRLESPVDCVEERSEIAPVHFVVDVTLQRARRACLTRAVEDSRYEKRQYTKLLSTRQTNKKEEPLSYVLNQGARLGIGECDPVAVRQALSVLQSLSQVAHPAFEASVAEEIAEGV